MEGEERAVGGDDMADSDRLLEIHGLVGQLVEVYRNQNDLIEQIDADLRADRSKARGERGELRGLMVQLIELGRKQVRGLSDLERAIYGGVLPADRDRQINEELAAIAADEARERKAIEEQSPKRVRRTG